MVEYTQSWPFCFWCCDCMGNSASLSVHDNNLKKLSGEEC